MEVQAQVVNNVQSQPQHTTLISRLANFNMPSQAEYIDSLMVTDVAMAIILLACGLVYMLQGWKIFKMLVVVNAAILGGLLGNKLGGTFLQIDHGALFGVVAGALLLAVLSWPLMKSAVSLMGALAGGFVGYGLWSYVARAAGNQTLAQYNWAGALIGLIALGLLGFVVFKLVIMLFTSVQGSLMAVSGMVAIVCRIDTLRQSLQPMLRTNAHLLLLFITVPAVIGLVFQYAALAKKMKKKRPEGE